MKHAVLVTGDRNWTDPVPIMKVLGRFPPRTILIHGACRGADRIAGEVGEKLAFDVRPAPYIGGLGRAGGPVRNRNMVNDHVALRSEGYQCHVFAFHPDLANSTGTAGCVKLARKAGFDVEVING
jgi:hypothetical protein